MDDVEMLEADRDGERELERAGTLLGTNPDLFRYAAVDGADGLVELEPAAARDAHEYVVRRAVEARRFCDQLHDQIEAFYRRLVSSEDHGWTARGSERETSTGEGIDRRRS